MKGLNGEDAKNAADGVATVLRALGDFFVAIWKNFVPFSVCALIITIVWLIHSNSLKYDAGKADGMAIKEPILERYKTENDRLYNENILLHSVKDSQDAIILRLKEQNSYQGLIIKTKTN